MNTTTNQNAPSAFQLAGIAGENARREMARRASADMVPATVTHVRFVNGGRFHGAGTRVDFADGRTLTLMGRCSKGVAIRQAREHFAKEAA